MKRMGSSLAPWIALAGVALVCAGCSAGQQHAAQQNLNAASTSAPVQAMKNMALAAAVAGKLATVNVDAALTVHVRAADGTITLEGQAKTAREKAEYAAAARSVRGVARVIDLLAVDPHLRGARETFGDAGRVAKVQAAIAAEAGLNVLKISATAKAGVVTLRGTVPTAAIRSTVTTTAARVEGVRRVVDELQTSP